MHRIHDPVHHRSIEEPMIDNNTQDAAAVEALCDVDLPNNDVAYSTCLTDQQARAILAAIREGKVPGIGERDERWGGKIAKRRQSFTRKTP